MSNNKLGSSSVFLVSGGGKGVTAHCVIALAKRHQCKFILLGRSRLNKPEPTWAKGALVEADLKRRAVTHLQATAQESGQKVTPAQVEQVVRAVLSKREIESTLKKVREVGGQAQYLSVDVTDAQVLRKELASVTQQMIRVTGIIHGAAVLADKPIEKKSEADFERVYQAKVTGLQNLLACVPPSQLQHLVLFSSVAGFYGNVGQADYASANEILNKMAYQVQRDNPHCHVISLNWGPWDGGMVTPNLKQTFAERNINLIPLSVGAMMFVDELERHGQPQIIIGSPIETVAAPKSDSALRVVTVQRTLRLAENPFLHDHVIGGHPVLPAACAAAWMVNLSEQLALGYRLHQFRQFRVLKGIVFDGTEAENYQLDMREISCSAAELVWEAKIWSEAASGKPRYHYSGQVVLSRHSITPPNYATFYRDERQALAGAEFYHNRILFHGSAFQGVQRVLNFSPERLTMQCSLPPLSLVQQGQFPVQSLNPYLLDVQLQGMLIWAEQFLQKGCLPAAAAVFTQYRPLSFDEPFFVSLEVRARHKTSFVADIFTHDAEGDLYSHTVGLEVTLSERLKGLF